MKQILCAFLIFVSTQAFAAPTYPLTCVFSEDQSISVSPSLTHPRENKISFSFRKGTRPASMGVEPGTCAWADRGLNPNEPTVVIATVPAGTTYIRRAGSPMSFPHNSPWVFRAINETNYQITFNVYATNEGEPISYFKAVY